MRLDYIFMAEAKGTTPDGREAYVGIGNRFTVSSFPNRDLSILIVLGLHWEVDDQDSLRTIEMKITDPMGNEVTTGRLTDRGPPVHVPDKLLMSHLDLQITDVEYPSGGIYALTIHMRSQGPLPLSFVVRSEKDTAFQA